MFLCLEVGRLLGERNLCAWPDRMFFLSHPLTATAGNRIMSHTNLCNSIQCCSCATLPTCCREDTYHGPGFNPRFQAVKSYTLQQLTFNHLFDLIFAQSCPWGEADEITCNRLQRERDLSVSSHFKKKDLSSLAANSSITLPTVLLRSLSNYPGQSSPLQL